MITPTKQEEQWLKDAKKLFKRLPRNTIVFVTGGSLNLIRCGADGRPVNLPNNGGYDQDYMVDGFVSHGLDGGDW